MTGGLGTYHGPSKTVPFDRWFRYPAGFNQDVLTRCFDAAGTSPGALVVDPFAGAATVGTASLSRGIDFVGIEAHPLIARLGNLKLAAAPLADPHEALAAVTQPFQQNIASEHELVRRCFEPATLRTLVGIRERVERGDGGEWGPWLTWALLGTLRDVANVAVGWPYLRPSRARVAPYKDASKRFQARFRAMLEDVETSRDWSATGTITQGNSGDSMPWKTALGERSAAGCISSPPYLNNFDYADATRLEVFFLGEASSWRELCTEFRRDMLIATTQQTSRAQSDADLSAIVELPQVGDEFETVFRRLSTERRRRPRGKEYDAAFAGYFAGILKVLTHLYTSCSIDARVAWVIGDSAPYGVHVDTPRLIGEIGETIGFLVLSNEKIRSRGQRWRTNGTRHQVSLSERLLLMTRS